MTDDLAIMAVASIIKTGLQGYYSLRCGHPLAACGAGRLGRGVPWPEGDAIPAITNIAVCGESYCGRITQDRGGVFAGMRATMQSRHIALALTERPGGPADRRQVYATAYDNPAMVLHITGDDMVWLDYFARIIREAHDMTAHITTPYGTINGLRIGPPMRTARPDRPRYDLTLDIEAEYVRPTQEA